MTPTKLPHIFQIEITSRCSMKCNFCPHPVMERVKTDMTPDTFKSILGRYLIPGQRIGLYMMGEPLLHPNFYEFVEYVASKGGIPEIATNSLSLHNREARDLLLRSKLAYVIMDISRWKERAEVMNRAMANVSSTVYEALKRLRRGEPTPILAIQIVTHAKHPQDFPDLVKEAVREFPARILLKRKFLDTWAGQLKEMYDHTEVAPPPVRTPCHEPFQRVAVLQNGDVVPCCRDAHGLVVYGNLMRESLADIWAGPIVRSVREKMLADMYDSLPEPCRSCRESHIPMDRRVEKEVL